jgi:predicted transcriptional regulator
MNKSELKDKLIATITETEDKRLLEDIFRIINIETEPQGLYELSETELNAVKEGVEQLNNGQFISNEDLNARMNEWIGQ